MYSTFGRHPCATCPIGGEDEILAREERIEARRARVDAKITAAHAEVVLPTEIEPTPRVHTFSSSSDESDVSTEDEVEKVEEEDDAHPPVPTPPQEDATQGVPELGSDSSTDEDEVEVEIDPFYVLEEDEDEVNPYKESFERQKEQSRRNEGQLIRDGETWVTNVLVAAQSREFQRRERVKVMRKERFEKLRQEADESAELYKELEAGWNIKAEKILPLELYEQIQEQQRAADRVLERKDIQIDELRQALDEADWEFEEVLGFYQKDIMLIGDRIDDHMDTLFASFINELALIEEHVETEEKEMLAEYSREWDEMMSEYEAAERESLDDRQSQALNRFSSMGEKYENVKEEMRQFRRQLEDDYRTLVLLFENYKFASLLNLEKLDYNLKVVRRRELENLQMRSSLKRAMLKYRDIFNSLRDEFAMVVTMAKREAKEVIKEANRLQEQNTTALQMLLHMARVDYHKFMDYWISSEKEAKRRLNLLLDIQEFIFHRMLGLKLPKPDLSDLDLRPKEVQAFIFQLDYDEEMLKTERGDPTAWGRKTATASDPPGTDDTGAKDWSGTVAGTSRVDLPLTADSSQPTREKSKLKSAPSFFLNWSPSLNLLPEPETDPEFQRKVMNELARVIGNETGFLLEEKLRKMISPMMKSERELVQFDAVLGALGIETIPEMQLLARYMIRHCTVMKGILAKWDDVSAPILESMQVSADELPSYYSSVDTVALERVNRQISRRLLEVEFVEAEDEPKGELKPVVLPRILYCDELQQQPSAVLTKEGEQAGEGGSEVNPSMPSTSEVAALSLEDQGEGREGQESEEKTVHSTGSMDTPEGCHRRTLSFKTDESMVMTWYKGRSTCDCEKVEGICICDLESKDTEDAAKNKEGVDESGIPESVAGSGDDGSVVDSASIPSLDSSEGNEDFLYIPPNDVLRALAGFLREFNAKTKLEKPTPEETVALKLSKLRFPNAEEMNQYWSQFLPQAQHFDSDGFWESLLQIFADYHVLLKERNKSLVELEAVGKQNEELATLLRAHMTKFSLPGVDLNRITLPYCQN